MEKSPSFAEYYVRFIAHCLSVYEGSAPMLSLDRECRQCGKVHRWWPNAMKDVLGRGYLKSQPDLPESELYDDEWPYYGSQRSCRVCC